jgi:wyosine [tRNA(Phe)-imidazoG37] synthetase (radical SAM superfamily)
MKYKHLFGPVPSRRLGVSLGVDLIPHKTCTLDCVYCECGKTTNLAIERKEYIPVKAVMEELTDYLSGNPYLDFITFSGSGEPTLNKSISLVVDFLKSSYPRYKLCLLTNGTLFSNPALRSEVQQIDLIIPSLDAATEKVFQELNRPHINLRCNEVIEGLARLRLEHKKEITLEIFIVPGLNDTGEEVAALREAILRIKPDRVQLATLDRPGTEKWVKKAGSKKMSAIAAALDGAELIGQFQSRQKITSFNESYQRSIIQTLRRRPCTTRDLEKILNLHPAELQKYISHLLETDIIEVEQKGRGAFLKIK